MSFVSPEPNTGCWLWTGATNQNYGIFGLGYAREGDRRKGLAHRLAYEWFVGPIPLGLEVMHACDMKLCVNPDHLRIGTHQENVAEMANRWRGARSKSGNLFGVLFHGRKKKLQRPYQSKVHFQKRLYLLGYYSTAEEASAVAIAFKEKCYREGAPK